MLTCKEATRMISEGQDRVLAVRERIQLEMHLTMCRGCRNYRQQMAFLRAACRHVVRQTAGDGDRPPEA